MITKSLPHPIDNSVLSIPDAEEIIEDALNDEIASSPNPGLTRALQFLAPAGYQAIVELCGENGRSKRRDASASSWSPEEDELRIYFERAESDDAVQPRSRSAARISSHPVALPIRNSEDQEDDSQLAALPADMDVCIKELCAALAEAERGGHAFIALKWFRDAFLPRKAFRWNQHPDSRQMVLAECIQRGVVVTSKIPNPKTPAYPTTTIRLNRAEAGLPEEAQRFRPVTVLGESISADLDHERGTL